MKQIMLYLILNLMALPFSSCFDVPIPREIDLISRMDLGMSEIINCFMSEQVNARVNLARKVLSTPDAPTQDLVIANSTITYWLSLYSALIDPTHRNHEKAYSEWLSVVLNQYTLIASINGSHSEYNSLYATKRLLAEASKTKVSSDQICDQTMTVFKGYIDDFTILKKCSDYVRKKNNSTGSTNSLLNLIGTEFKIILERIESICKTVRKESAHPINIIFIEQSKAKALKLLERILRQAHYLIDFIRFYNH